MRHVGQGFEIPVPLPSTRLGPDNLAAMREAFFASYRERFGRVVEDSPIEAMSWRLACLAPGQDIRIKPVAAKDASKDASTTSDARRGTRDVLFEGLGSVSCAVYEPLRARARRDVRRAGAGGRARIHLLHRTRRAGQRRSVSQSGDRSHMTKLEHVTAGLKRHQYRSSPRSAAVHATNSHLILRCERSEPRRMAASSECPPSSFEARPAGLAPSG